MSNGRRWKKGLMFRLGTNVQGDLRWVKLSGSTKRGSVGGGRKFSAIKRPRWQKSVEFAGLTKQKRVRNRWLSQSLMSSVGSQGSDVRVRDSYGTSRLQRKKLNMMYGFGLKMSHRVAEDLLKRSLNGIEYRTSLLGDAELHLNVVRWRSGLVTSVGMADDLITAGFVTVYRSDGTCVRVVHPKCPLQPGMVVQIDPVIWSSISGSLRSHWSMLSNERLIPTYLKVCFDVGSVAVLWVPRNGETAMPANMTYSLKSLYLG